MKYALASLLMILTTSTFAAGTPIRDNVALKNEKFSKLIYTALKKNIKPQVVVRTGASQNVIEVKGLITCSENSKLVSGGKTVQTHKCVLKEGAWNELGRDIYGSGDNEKGTKLLYASLALKAEKDEAFTTKQIEYNTPDSNGGTERNLLNCMAPNKLGEQYGLRSSCQLINAM